MRSRESDLVQGRQLDARHQATLEKVLAHPVSHNIEWHDLLSSSRGNPIWQSNQRYPRDPDPSVVIVLDNH